ncbi:MAG TPA: Uma2 family endonuclease [Herpetosiphonaceae bacterium]
MAVAQQFITAQELLQMPDDGYRYELVEGELRRMSPAGQQHGRIVLNLSAPLHQHVRSRNLGTVYAAETGFLLASNPDTVRAPDVAFVQQARTMQVETGYYSGAPDLVAEVISPHDLYTEVEEKVLAWLAAGTSMVLVVNPRKRTVTMYRSLTEITVLTESDQLDGADVVPGWTITVNEIFS